MLKKTTKTRTNVVHLLRTQSQDSDTCISGFCDPEELSQPERDFSCIDDSINFLNVCDFFVSPKFCDKKLRRMTKMTCYFFSFSISQFLVSLHKPTLVYRGKKTNLFFLLIFFYSFIETTGGTSETMYKTSHVEQQHFPHHCLHPSGYIYNF